MTRRDARAQPKLQRRAILGSRSFGDDVVKAVYDLFAWGGSPPIHPTGYHLDELVHRLGTISDEFVSRQKH